MLARIALALALVGACVTSSDYKDPAVGVTGLTGVEMCRAQPYLPCGWVYECGPNEFCLPWPDRSEIPKLKEMAESLYGDCELSRHPRYAGTPLCFYQCPSGVGCNSAQGCFCLDEAP